MEENKIHQLPADTRVNPAQNSDPGNDRPPPTTANDGEELKTKGPDTVRESKRRKSCPSALDKCEAIINSSFSFNFDPNFCSGATTPEITPKFGSFNLVVPTTAAEIEVEIEEKTEEDEEEEKNQVIKKRKIIDISVDGIKSAD